MIEALIALFKPFLVPLIADIVQSILHKQSIDPEYVKKLTDATSKYREAETNEEKRLARIALIELSRK